jgi:cytochrome P450
VQTFFRTTTRSVEIAGTTIPDGSKVLLFLGAANRDPREWRDPDRFDIRRRPAGHVAFGSGIHACVGAAIARLEAECLLTAMIRQIDRLEPAGPAHPLRNNTLRGWTSLPLRVRSTWRSPRVEPGGDGIF